MKVIKKKSKKTYVNKNKEEKHFYNYFLQTENGKRILIKPVMDEDYTRLDMVAEYEG